MTDTSVRERLARRAARSAGMPEDKSWAYQTMVDDILAELVEPSDEQIKATFAKMPKFGAIDPMDFYKAMIQHIRDGGL